LVYRPGFGTRRGRLGQLLSPVTHHRGIFSPLTLDQPGGRRWPGPRWL